MTLQKRARIAAVLGAASACTGALLHFTGRGADAVVGLLYGIAVGAAIVALLKGRRGPSTT